MPILTFHELGRHSSSTYKLSLSRGDYKTVQGDFGHSNTKVLLDTYAQIEMSKRRSLLKKVENDFKLKQSKSNSESNDSTIDENSIISQIQEHPELITQILKSLMSMNV